MTTQVNKMDLNKCMLPSLIDIGTCNLHKVHNGFGKGLNVLGSDAEDLALKLFYWFKRSATQCEAFSFS